VIRRIRIRDWRPYRDATIKLDHPVVFFVAPNGVGKTSVYEAARFCLFGFPKGRTAGRAVRAGADRAELSMDLAVGAGVTVTVTRTLTRAGRTTFAAVRDGEGLDEGAFLALLQRSWAADPALLDRLVFGDSDPLARAKAPLPVREHLAELLGVTPMLDAAAVLRTAQATADETVAGLRIEAAGSEAAISQAEAAVASAQEAQSEILAERQSARQRLGVAEQAANAAAAWEDYRTAVAAYNDQVETLLSEVGELITVDPGDPSAGLDRARRAAERDLEAARRAAEADRAAARAATAADLLTGAGGVCPTCLRPLSNEELAAALHAHGQTATRAGAETEHAAAATSRTERHLRAIGEFTRRLDRLQRPVPPDGQDPGTSAKTELAELRALDGALGERLGEARARLDAAMSSLQAARDSAADSARLNRAAREELLLDTTAGILEAVADRYLSERIEPLKRDIAHRWKLVFGTEGLVLDPTGNIRLRRGDVELGLDDMSGGERAVAGVIVRLLVAATATRIPALWFDEPLEHLDPRRRAGVAQTLVQAAAAVGTVDQIVVTTYEEGIAHRLALAAPGLVAIVHADDRAARPETTAP